MELRSIQGRRKKPDGACFLFSAFCSFARETNTSALCGSGNSCDSSLIPLNHTVVVPGGRYRKFSIFEELPFFAKGRVDAY